MLVLPVFPEADGRTRTADLLITNQLLYQLSYVSAGWEAHGGSITAVRQRRLITDPRFVAKAREKLVRRGGKQWLLAYPRERLPQL